MYTTPVRVRNNSLIVIGLSVFIGSGCASFRGVEDSKTDSMSQAYGSARFSTQAPLTPELNAEYHFSMAQAYSTEGNSDRAIEEYKLALVYDPNSALIQTRLSAEYIKKGMLAAALEASREAVRVDPEYVDARLLLAGLYSASHDLESAISEYQHVVRLQPQHEEATVYLAQTLVEANRGSEAMLILKSYLKRDDDSVLVWYTYGRVAQSLNQMPEAIRALKRASDLRPQFTQSALALGAIYEESGNNRQALEAYQKVFEVTQDLGAANRIATILLKEEKYKEALPYLVSIRDNDPDDLNVRVKLGLVYVEQKEFEKAITLFQEILAKTPDSDRIHFYLGNIYEELKQSDQAITHFSKIDSTSKLFGDAVLHQVSLMKDQGKTKEAYDITVRALEQAPFFVGLYLFRAHLEEETNQVDQAIVTLEKAVQRFPDEEKVRYYLGILFDRKGQFDRATVQMEALLKNNPKNVDALNYLGYTWTMQGIRMKEAEEVLKKALALRPDNGYIRDSWGWHLFVRGKYAEAVRELEKAVALKPGEAVIHEHLGDAYLRMNLWEKALKQYDYAVNSAEDEVTRKKLLVKADQLRGQMGQGEEKGRLPATQQGNE